MDEREGGAERDMRNVKGRDGMCKLQIRISKADGRARCLSDRRINIKMS